VNIVLLGPPGAGKGTQAKRLQARLGYPHVASGDIFRAIAREATPLGAEVRRYMDRGQYVPDPLTNQLVLARLDRDDAKRGFLLDGYPRTRPQAEALDAALAKEGRRVDVTLYITAPTELLTRRITGRLVCPNCGAIYNEVTRPPRLNLLCDVCGHRVERRSDEDPTVVRTRLDVYIAQTRPLVEYYAQRHTLVEVDGSRPMDEVEAHIDSALGLDVKS
jgi:adenylate kinase